MKTFWLTALILILSFISGCINSSQVIDDQIPVSYLEITNLSCNEEGSSGISGNIKNLDDDSFKKVSVKYSIYNEYGARIYYNYATVYRIEPQQSVRFVGLIADGNVKSLCNAGKTTIKAFAFPPDFDISRRACKSMDNDILVIDYFNYSTSFGSPIINGYIENTGPNWYESILLKAEIFDSNNIRIGEAGTRVQNVEGYERVMYSMVINDYIEEKLQRHENIRLQIKTTINC